MAKKTAKKRATKKRTAKKKANRRPQAKNAQCSCGATFAKQRKVCDKCGAEKPSGGWATPTTNSPNTVDLIALTAETIQRLANASDEVTLDTFKNRPELTLEAILASENCPDWIKVDYDEGEFAKKLNSISDADYKSLKENTER